MARTRPGSDRPFRFPGADDGPSDGADEDEEATDVDGQQQTSLEDLTTVADPSQFDRTFLADDANLTIQGAFDPVAGSRQVIPRVAYVIDYNLIWDPDAERWEPDEGNDDGGGVTVLDSGTVSLSFAEVREISTSVTDPNIDVGVVVGLDSPGDRDGEIEFLLKTGDALASSENVAYTARWDEPDQQWTVIIDNNTDYTRDYRWYLIDWGL